MLLGFEGAPDSPGLRCWSFVFSGWCSFSRVREQKVGVGEAPVGPPLWCWAPSCRSTSARSRRQQLVAEVFCIFLGLMLVIPKYLWVSITLLLLCRSLTPRSLQYLSRCGSLMLCGPLMLLGSLLKSMCLLCVYQHKMCGSILYVTALLCSVNANVHVMHMKRKKSQRLLFCVCLSILKNMYPGSM